MSIIWSKSLTLTTLAERRMKGDLIEAFKFIQGFVDYGQNLLKLSISGLDILSKITGDTTSDRGLFSERILKYWNTLPKNVKMSESVNSFKANLENYKSIKSVVQLIFSIIVQANSGKCSCQDTSRTATGSRIHHTKPSRDLFKVPSFGIYLILKFRF